MGDYLKTATILYVEDNEEVRLGYAKALKRYAKELYVANDGFEGFELFQKQLIAGLQRKRLLAHAFDDVLLVVDGILTGKTKNNLHFVERRKLQRHCF